MDFPLVLGFPTDSKFEKIVRRHLELSRREAQQFLSGQFPEEISEEGDSKTFAEKLIDQAEDLGAHGVMVMSRRDKAACPPCLNHDGAQYKIPEARQQEPLPHQACENAECRCSYVPIMRAETYADVQGEETDLPGYLDH